MRNKIIGVNAAIVLLVGFLSWMLVTFQLQAVASNAAQLTARARHDAQSAAAKLQFDALRVERWLAGRTGDPAVLDVINKASPTARGESATALADQILAAAKNSPAAFESYPSLVTLLDEKGRVIGRNGSNLSRGDDLGAIYPGLKEAVAKGRPGSDLWLNKERNDQYLASYVPVIEGGVVKGAIAIGLALNDELSRVAEATTGSGLLLAVQSGSEVSVAAKSQIPTSQQMADAVGTAKDDVGSAIASGHTRDRKVGDLIVAYAGLGSLGDGKRGAVVAAAPTSLIGDVSGIPLGIFGAAGIGLVLVVAMGWILGNYISRPISVLEEGLLAILNGQSDKRFELDHAELGGLAFRIDQLLNQFMGIEEDTTDDEGRVSVAPRAANFADAMSVDRGGAGGSAPGEMDAAATQALANEPADRYYARLFQEYIAAKKVLGEETSHITEQQFVSRIQGMEQEASSKHGKPVRYRVQTENRAVTLLAIPLG